MENKLKNKLVWWDSRWIQLARELSKCIQIRADNHLNWDRRKLILRPFSLSINSGLLVFLESFGSREQMCYRKAFPSAGLPSWIWRKQIVMLINCISSGSPDRGPPTPPQLAVHPLSTFSVSSASIELNLLNVHWDWAGSSARRRGSRASRYCCWHRDSDSALRVNLDTNNQIEFRVRIIIIN